MLTVAYQIVMNVFLVSKILQNTRKMIMPMTNPHLLRCLNRLISNLLSLCLRLFRLIRRQHGLPLDHLSQRNVMHGLALG
jgi:hypothetical protein